MTNQSFPGDVLRARRLELGLSVDDVYKKIRIPSRYVDAFEEARLDELPASTYAHGFLRTYCLTLQLDPEPMLKALSEFQSASTGRLSPRGFVTASRRASRGAAGWRPAELTTWLAICGLLALGWFAYTVVVNPNTDGQEGQVQAETRSVEIADPPNLFEWP